MKIDPPASKSPAIFSIRQIIAGTALASIGGWVISNNLSQFMWLMVRYFPVLDQQAERLPRIYIYEHPVQSGFLEGSDCPRDMYYMETLLPRLIEDSPFRTYNPEHADFYLIPHESTCLYHRCVHVKLEGGTDICKLEANNYIMAIIKHIKKSFPYLKRTSGIDHLIVQTWDQSSEVYGWNSEAHKLANSRLIRLSTLGYVGVHANFNAHKDIVIPPFIDFDVFNYWQDNLKDTFNASDPLFGRRSIAYFRGTVIDDEAYSRGVRQYINDNLAVKYANDPRRYQIYKGHTSPASYLMELRWSLFALCPSGWSPWSPRVFEAIFAGTIPVLFSDGIRLPFEDFLDYRSFMVKLHNANVSHLDQIIEPLVANHGRNEERLREMRAIREAFWWRSVYENPNAFNPLLLLMRELAKKIRKKPVGNEEFYD